MTVAGQSSVEFFDVCVVNILQQHLFQPAQKLLTVPVLVFLYQGALEWTDGQCPGCIQAVQMFVWYIGLSADEICRFWKHSEVDPFGDGVKDLMLEVVTIAPVVTYRVSL